MSPWSVGSPQHMNMSTVTKQRVSKVSRPPLIVYIKYDLFISTSHGELLSLKGSCIPTYKHTHSLIKFFLPSSASSSSLYWACSAGWPWKNPSATGIGPRPLAPYWSVWESGCLCSRPPPPSCSMGSRTGGRSLTESCLMTHLLIFLPNIRLVYFITSFL